MAATTEMKLFLSELTESFQMNEDAASVARIQDTVMRMKKIKEEQEEQIKNVIKELTRRVSIAESRLSQSDSRSAVATQLAQLKATDTILKDKLNQSKLEVEEIRGKIDAVKKSIIETKEEKELTLKTMKTELPAKKSLLVLYANISRIRWDYDHPSAIKGVLSVPNKQDIKSFEFSRDSMDDYAIANQLWQMME